MIDQSKAAFVAAVTTASGGASIISENTLLPLGIFVAGISVACVTAWRVAVAVTKASDRLERIEQRLDTVEARCIKKYGD